MIDRNNAMRRIARAAKLRDWIAVDAVLEDLRISGDLRVICGYSDARKELGLEPKLPPLVAPDPVTIHDLPNRDEVEIDGTEGSTRTWRKRKAA